MFSWIKYEIVMDHIAVITINRPKAANSLSKALLNELNTVVEEIDQNKAIYCTILTGAGDKVFCAGADLKERNGMSDDQVIEVVSYISETITKVEQMKMPVIAALNGVALGGGLELALACDIRIAAENIKIGLTETSLAIIPGAGGTQRLTRLIGLGQAKRLIFTAIPILANDALHIGLVEQVVPFGILEEETIKIAKNIIKNGPIALRVAKKAINEGNQADLSTGLTIEHSYYVETIATADRQEGLLAFKEKRKPQYKGM